MQSKSLGDLLALGLQPSSRSLKSSIGQWLGKQVSLKDGDFWSAWLGGSNFSGQTVTVNSALQLSTAWACVRLIAETMATLPFNLLKDQKDGSKEAATDHQLYGLLHSQPNDDMSAVDFWTAYLASMLLRGYGAAEKNVSASGFVTSIDFLIPDNLQVQKDRSWRYRDPDTGTTRIIPKDRVWYTPAFSLDGKSAISPIQFGANVIGGAIAADKASAHTFKNGMKASGMVTMAGLLKPDQRDQVREHVAKVSAAGGVYVLESGSGFQQLTMNPQDAELLATRHFNVEEICRWWRVPPFMVGHAAAGQTNWGTGIESQMMGFITFVLRPWAVRIEQSVRRCLLTPVERTRMSAEFALEGLLRGDSAARAAFYSQMVQNGVMTRDDVRRLENLPLMGGNANVLTVQSNLLPIDKLGQQITSTNAQNALKNWLGIDDAQAPLKETP